MCLWILHSSTSATILVETISFFLLEVLFFFILQYLSRAIVLTSFDDATRSFEERQRTKKLLGDQLASFFKLQVWESGKGEKTHKMVWVWLRETWNTKQGSLD